MKTAFEKMRQGRARCEAAKKRTRQSSLIEAIEREFGRPATYEEKKSADLHGWVAIDRTLERQALEISASRPWWRLYP